MMRAIQPRIWNHYRRPAWYVQQNILSAMQQFQMSKIPKLHHVKCLSQLSGTYDAKIMSFNEMHFPKEKKANLPAGHVITSKRHMMGAILSLLPPLFQPY